MKKTIKKMLGLEPYERILLHRQILSKYRALPDFVIIGTQKGGTTSLFNYLVQHPEIVAPYRKEVHYFNRSYRLGTSYYKAYFPLNRHGVKLTGEASPDYFDNPLVPERMHALIPNAKIILLLRNPISRAFSHFQMMRKLGFESHSFSSAIKQEKIRVEKFKDKVASDPYYYDLSIERYSYLQKGFYYQHLKNWENFYSPNQMLILKSEDFFFYPDKTFKEVLEFLGVDPDWKLSDGKSL